MSQENVGIVHAALDAFNRRIEVQARVAFTFTIRGGKIERVCMYQERQEAVEAAGLRE